MYVVIGGVKALEDEKQAQCKYTIDIFIYVIYIQYLQHIYIEYDTIEY